MDEPILSCGQEAIGLPQLTDIDGQALHARARIRAEDVPGESLHFRGLLLARWRNGSPALDRAR